MATDSLPSSMNIDREESIDSSGVPNDGLQEEVIDQLGLPLLGPAQKLIDRRHPNLPQEEREEMLAQLINGVCFHATVVIRRILSTDMVSPGQGNGANPQIDW